VIDVPGFTSGLATQAQALGAEIQTAVAVRSIAVAGGRITGVTLADGTLLAAGSVVVAAGAWNASLGHASGAALPLVPMRRHLVELTTEANVSRAEPAIWRLEDEVYYRKQGAGVLASPCDETSARIDVASASPSAADPAAKSLLHAKLARLAPSLAGGAVVRAWSCLRTFASDRELVVGADPRVQGLYWFGGLGGRGMSVAPAAAEWLAMCIRGEAPPPQAAVAAPSRLVENAEFG
jgi:D-arginine dehydrogenase